MFLLYYLVVTKGHLNVCTSQNDKVSFWRREETRYFLGFRIKVYKSVNLFYNRYNPILFLNKVKVSETHGRYVVLEMTRVPEVVTFRVRSERPLYLLVWLYTVNVTVSWLPLPP